MVVGGEQHKTGAWAALALERLAHDELPPTPRNYAVYYRYFSSEDLSLNAAYESCAAQGKITQQQCDELYYKYLSTDVNLSFLKDTSTTLDEELKKILDVLGVSAKETGDYGKNLHAFSRKLSDEASIDILREAVGKIAEETRVVTAQNHKLQEDLKLASQQINEMCDGLVEMHKEAQIDPLTEVGNRKFFSREIAQKIAEAQAQKSVLSLLMVDIDHFKRFNDTFGHLIGDQVLRLVARTLVENLKGRDVIARYGGEEFVIILPNTCLRDAELVANHLRAALATKRIKKRGSNEVLGIVTVSLGAAEYVSGEEEDMLVSRADSALYTAKQTGRNKVVCASSEQK